MAFGMASGGWVTPRVARIRFGTQLRCAIDELLQQQTLLTGQFD